MKIDVKDLEILNRYNGVNITQTCDSIKLSCEVYINKVAEGHPWLQHITPPHRFPVPMNAEPKFSRQMEEAVPPLTRRDQTALQNKMGVHYRQIVGELLCAMVTCHLDVSFRVVKLSQYSVNPARVHYEAAQTLLAYLYATKTDGLYYW